LIVVFCGTLVRNSGANGKWFSSVYGLPLSEKRSGRSGSVVSIRPLPTNRANASRRSSSVTTRPFLICRVSSASQYSGEWWTWISDDMKEPSVDDKKEKPPRPSEDEFRRAMIAKAIGFCPPIYPCANCGWPVITGYCCLYCGSTRPDEANST
jgi:hypothetical protein